MKRSEQTGHGSGELDLWITVAATVIATLLIVAATSAQAQTFSVLHSFSGPDGANPFAGLTLDQAGNLYGTTLAGGNTTRTCPLSGCGTVFKLTHVGSGWVLHELYLFSGGDGEAPQSKLTFGPNGTLYGTTAYGGSGGGGTVFSLRPPGSVCKSASCLWTDTVLFPFGYGTGSDLTGDITFDAAGNIYGTTFSGGDYQFCGGLGCGTVYQLTGSGGTWTENILHAFTDAADGEYSNSGVILDQAGNVYGTAPQNQFENGYGLVFELTHPGSGWSFNPVYRFQNGADGGGPWPGLISDQAGNMYGTTSYGGSARGGTVFQLSPSGDSWNFKSALQPRRQRYRLDRPSRKARHG